MEFKKFIIEKYKAIDFTELQLNSNLIPIIGINESGKTTILEAILCFDKTKDGYNKGRHLEWKNKYLPSKGPAIISAEAIITSDKDLEQLSKRMKLTLDSELMKELAKCKKDKTSIKVSRNLETKRYSVGGFNLEEPLNDKLAIAIFDILPFLLYFDDFSDRVPEKVEFTKAQMDKEYSPGKSKAKEWHNLVQEIFHRSTNGKLSLKDFVGIIDNDDKRGVLSDIKGQLNEEIIEDWKALKRRWKSLGDDIDDLEMNLVHESEPEDKEFKFEFKVEDKTMSGKSRFFSINQRSKGFQWFFNFTIKLKFNTRYNDAPSGAIYLLDEPGSYLHSSAQEELLHELKRISNNNIIIYCTHSQHLLDPDLINVSKIKIAEKEGGDVLLSTFGSAKTNKYQGALSPLYDALHLKIGYYKFDKQKVVITEGVTDYYFFKMLMEFSSLFTVPKLSIIPGAGAGHLKELISFAITWSSKYLILLDSDKAGGKGYRKYEDHFGKDQAMNFYKYCTPSKKEKVVLENFLSHDDQKKIKNITGSKHVKDAYIKLFFMDSVTKKDFVEKLDIKTLKNLSLVIDRINQLK